MILFYADRDVPPSQTTILPRTACGSPSRMPVTARLHTCLASCLVYNCALFPPSPSKSRAAGLLVLELGIGWTKLFCQYVETRISAVSISARKRSDTRPVQRGTLSHTDAWTTFTAICYLDAPLRKKYLLGVKTSNVACVRLIQYREHCRNCSRYSQLGRVRSRTGRSRYNQH